MGIREFHSSGDTQTPLPADPSPAPVLSFEEKGFGRVGCGVLARAAALGDPCVRHCPAQSRAEAQLGHSWNVLGAAQGAPGLCGSTWTLLLCSPSPLQH